MNLFFQIQSFQLVVFCINDEGFVTNLHYVLLCFLLIIIKVNHFLYCFILLLHLVSLLFRLLELCSFNVHMFPSNQLIALFYHYLNLKQYINFLSKNILPFIFKSLLCFNIDLLFLMNSL